MRGVESIGAGGDPAELAREAARALGVVASVTGPVDHVSDGERVVGGRERPSAARDDHRHGLHVDGDHGLLPRRRPTPARRRRSRRWSPSASPARTPRASAKGPGSFHVALYDALAALDPETLDGRARVA